MYTAMDFTIMTQLLSAGFDLKTLTSSSAIAERLHCRVG